MKRITVAQLKKLTEETLRDRANSLVVQAARSKVRSDRMAARDSEQTLRWGLLYAADAYMLAAQFIAQDLYELRRAR